MPPGACSVPIGWAALTFCSWHPIIAAPATAVSRIEAHVLHADNFLAFAVGDGVLDGHVIGGQVQFVGAGQWVVASESIREGRDWLVQQMEDRALDRPPQRLR